MVRFKEALKLFLIFLKIGAFTFGGGYAMISVIEDEIVAKRNWLTESELTDIIAIAESTPGPIAINSATCVGKRRAGFLGAFFATLGVVFPSLVIIIAIAAVIEPFWQLPVVTNAFRGIGVAVGIIILSAGIRMFRKMKKNALSLVLCSMVFFILLALNLFDVSLSSVWLILSGAACGLLAYLFTKRKGETDK